MFNPGALFTRLKPTISAQKGCTGTPPHLITLAPAAIRSLLADQKVARSARTFARFICFSHQRQTLESELGRITETDTPRTHPTPLALLYIMQIYNGATYGSPDG